VWKDGGGLGEVRAPGVAYSAGRYDIHWYKSNGCLFGSYQPDVMAGWDATLHVDGPGSNGAPDRELPETSRYFRTCLRPPGLRSGPPIDLYEF
jgi:hypothetical protein